jgi:hypothetical protein
MNFGNWSSIKISPTSANFLSLKHTGLPWSKRFGIVQGIAHQSASEADGKWRCRLVAGQVWPTAGRGSLASGIRHHHALPRQRRGALT